MIVELSLNVDKCGMWFLGQPRQTKVSFTFASPGPTQIDFAKLEKQEQEHLLRALQTNKINSSVLFTDLYQIYIEMHTKAPEPSQEVTNYLAATEKQKEHETALKQLKQREKREADLDSRCASIIKLSVRALKSCLAKEQDVRILRKIRALELQKGPQKSRRSILDFLDERIRKLTMDYQEQIVKELEKSANSKPLVDPYKPYDKISYEVEETEEDVIQFALGKPI